MKAGIHDLTASARFRNSRASTHAYCWTLSFSRPYVHSSPGLPSSSAQMTQIWQELLTSQVLLISMDSSIEASSTFPPNKDFPPYPLFVVHYLFSDTWSGLEEESSIRKASRLFLLLIEAMEAVSIFRAVLRIPQGLEISTLGHTKMAKAVLCHTRGICHILTLKFCCVLHYQPRKADGGTSAGNNEASEASRTATVKDAGRAFLLMHF